MLGTMSFVSYRGAEQCPVCPCLRGRKWGQRQRAGVAVAARVGRGRGGRCGATAGSPGGWAVWLEAAATPLGGVGHRGESGLTMSW